MSKDTTYHSANLTNPFLVFSSNNEPKNQFIHINFGSHDGLIEIQNDFTDLINLRTFSSALGEMQRKEIGKRVKQILSKYGLDKDKRLIGLLAHLIISANYDYPMTKLKNSIIGNSKNFIPLIFKSDNVGIKVDVNKIKEWMTWENYFKRARLTRWTFLKLIIANLSYYLDRIRPDESIAPSIIRDVLTSLDHELIKDKANPTKTISDLTYRAKNPKVKYCDCTPSQEEFEQKQWDEVGFTLF